MLDHVPQQFINIALIVELVFLLCTQGRPTPAQERKPVSGRAANSSVSRTKVEIKDGSGDFETWGDSLVISSDDAITLRWRTDEEGVASAMWVVSDSPTFAQANRINVSNIVNKGNLVTIPAKGHVELFNIQPSTFVTKSPPSSAKRYYICLITKDAQGNLIGQPSPVVTITYKQSSQDIPQLGTEYCHLSPRNTFASERCALRLFGFELMDAPNNRIVSGQPPKAIQILIKAPTGKKFQIDCHFTSSGKKPYQAFGPPLYQVTPNAGETHVIFTFEAKDSYWKTISIGTEDPYNFYGCLVTNLK